MLKLLNEGNNSSATQNFTNLSLLQKRTTKQQSSAAVLFDACLRRIGVFLIG
jgi:hypothetical protein